MSDVPRVARSLDDLRVGQFVSFVDDEDHRRDDVFRVAFVDPPEAILKRTHNGWPRIAWTAADFQLPNAHLFILSDPPVEPVTIPRDMVDFLRKAVERFETTTTIGENTKPALGLRDAARGLLNHVDAVEGANDE